MNIEKVEDIVSEIRKYRDTQGNIEKMLIDVTKTLAAERKAHKYNVEVVDALKSRNAMLYKSNSALGVKVRNLEILLDSGDGSSFKALGKRWGLSAAFISNAIRRQTSLLADHIKEMEIQHERDLLG